MTTQTVRIALAQINCVVGDLAGNCDRILEYAARARALGAHIVCFPELAVCGYPPEDLLLKPKFIQDNYAHLQALAKSINGITAVVGFVDKKGKNIYNAAALLEGGRVRGVYHKLELPNYGVFDEKRYFTAGDKPFVFALGRVLVGITICEDIWKGDGPARKEALMGARLILTINASPYHRGKIRDREAVIRAKARQHRAAVAYTNLIGGQDELVFDGQSMVADAGGKVIARAHAFKEDLISVDLDIPACARIPKGVAALPFRVSSGPVKVSPARNKPLEPVAEVYQALVLGLADYVKKNGFSKVVIGLSGGIDSALVGCIAADALGTQQVTCVFMPSRYSSQESQRDAREFADNAGMRFLSVSIEPIYKVYLLVLEQHFAGFERNKAEENLQARIRGSILMALSNKFGWLVLTTGNKSEMSTGYATLYGDMAGGFAVIKDVPKMLVYELARYRNSQGSVIPENIFTKAPTAELKPGQKDSDTLPEYCFLDPILKAYVEEDKDIEKIIAQGARRETVAKVVRMVDASEYKRRQSPPGVKITPKAFGRDRRMPITNRYRA